MTRALIAKIHIGKKQLALTDADYRALVKRITGQTSAAECSERQLEAVIGEMQRLGFRPTRTVKPSAKGHVRLIHALWAEARRCGAIQSGSPKALNAFVARQTGVDAPEWLTAKAANPVIEALKDMIRKAGGTIHARA